MDHEFAGEDGGAGKEARARKAVECQLPFHSHAAEDKARIDELREWASHRCRMASSHPPE